MLVWLARPSHLNARGAKGRNIAGPSALSAPAIRWDGLANQTSHLRAAIFTVTDPHAMYTSGPG